MVLFGSFQLKVPSGNPRNGTPCQGRSCEVGVHQGGSAQIGLTQIRPKQVDIAQVGPTQVGPAQLSLVQVWLDLRMLSPPNVPASHALLESLNLLRVCHSCTSLFSVLFSI